jgi:SAM-dependent methyltransferase
MANHRLQEAGLPGRARQGTILATDFADRSFDFVVAIGCLHHTGDLLRSLLECRRLLRPGGKLVFMVYYAYSYRRFYLARRETVRYALRELLGYRGVVGAQTDKERVAYDANTAGEAAPHTDFISRRSLRHLCRRFSRFSAQTENIDTGAPFDKSGSRRELLKTLWPRLCGLDLYATAVK